MNPKITVALLIAALGLSGCVHSKKVLGGYFTNWPQYRAAPYTYKPAQLKPIVGKLDHIMYAFAKFDDSFNLQPVEYDDDTMMKAVIAYKQQNSDLKVLLSVGGWTFPSAMFSKMASTKDNRAAFIKSLQAYLTKYGFDGVDLDWEYPCSAARKDYVKIQCTNMKLVTDAGGKCPEDAVNYLSLVQEMRSALGNKLITIASPAAPKLFAEMKIKEMSAFVDYWHIMTYDYTVSDISDSSKTAPNSPLYAPPSRSGVVQWSVNDTIQGYLSQGVPSEKMTAGFPLYGHTWFVPGLKDDEWKKFGLSATKQEKCCGEFKETYGAQFGKGSQQCGTYMYSETRAAGVQYYFDNTTKTAIGYLTEDSSDGWTKAGTWFSFNDKNSIEDLAKYIEDQNLAGAFIFDTSQDTIDFQSTTFTYELTNALYDSLQSSKSGNICSAGAVCNVCSQCCKSYLTSQRDCDGCVAISCK